MISSENLEKYLQLFVSDEVEREAVLDELRTHRDGELNCQDLVQAYEKVNHGNSETVIGAALALSLCHIYGEDLFKQVKSDMQNLDARVISANTVTEGLWNVLINDQRGIKAPLASVLMDPEATTVNFGESKNIWATASAMLENL